MPHQQEQRPLGTALVVGGCGFLGYHLVGHLLRDSDCSAVCVLDRNVDNDNRHDQAVYVCGTMTDQEAVRSLVAKIQPTVVFHIASPHSSLPTRRKGEFEETNVRGTQALLTVATEASSVKALVYTSTVDIYVDPPHLNVDESHPVWPAHRRSNEYNRTKAVADRLVRKANGPQLRTVCLRIGHAYGERHVQGLKEILEACAGDRTLVQLGDGSNLMEVVSADNAATAHVLAAKALVEAAKDSTKAGGVDGEAFNISDGSPVPFWHHVRVIWGVARGADALDNITVIPAWVMAVIVTIAEWVFWIFTLGTVEPPMAMRRLSLEYTTQTHTYSIQKARERLHFNPTSDHDAVLARSAQWMLDRQKL